MHMFAVGTIFGIILSVFTYIVFKVLAWEDKYGPITWEE